jgi:DNA-binding transcriptional LysR family regulator
MVVDSMLEGKVLNAETIYIDGLVETIKRRVLKGSGFAWMPQTAVAEELASGRLVQIGGESWTARLTIAALADPAGFDPVAREVWDRL